MEIEKSEVLYKVLVVGDIGTGKTSLVKRYVHGIFSPNYKSTIGVDFGLKVIQEEERNVRLQLWDVAGQERYGNMTRTYYHEAKGAVVVFDVTRASTFDAIEKWKTDIDSKLNGLAVILLANKMDLIAKEPEDSFWTEKRKEIAHYCHQKGFKAWFEISVKDNINVKESFDRLIQEIDELENDPNKRVAEQDDSRIRLGEQGDQERSTCSC